ncbi:unnamed protein product, partial [Linum tenue]
FFQRAYYFSNDYLKSLFEESGFRVEELDVYCKQVENRSRELVMNRDQNLRINLLSKEYQHTCRSTGLMLWESARLMSSIIAGNPSIVAGKKVLELALILCHVVRRVDEPSIILAASRFGFKLVDKWTAAAPSQSQSIISSWFLKSGCEIYIPSRALNILYFQAGAGNK